MITRPPDLKIAANPGERGSAGVEGTSGSPSATGSLTPTTAWPLVVVERWVRRSCVSQAIPVHVGDLATVTRVASLLGIGGPAESCEAASARSRLRRTYGVP